MKIKTSWMFSIVKALEERYEYLSENNDISGEGKVLKEALNYFKSLEMKEE